MEINQLYQRMKASKDAYEKQLKTIERHKKSIAKKEIEIKAQGGDLSKTSSDYFHSNDLYWLFSNLEGAKENLENAEKKLRQLEVTIAKWEQKVKDNEAKKEKIEQDVPQAIKDFLNDWADKAFNWYIERLTAYRKLRNKIGSDYNLGEIDYPEYKSKLKDLKDKYYDTILGILLNSTSPVSKLRSIIEKDKENKTLDLIRRVESITGKIIDAKHLEVSEKGELDGIVIGEIGKAKVETISAGGYNIQCFHYRVLVKEIDKML